MWPSYDQRCPQIPDLNQNPPVGAHGSSTRGERRPARLRIPGRSTGRSTPDRPLLLVLPAGQGHPGSCRGQEAPVGSTTSSTLERSIAWKAGEACRWGKDTDTLPIAAWPEE